MSDGLGRSTAPTTWREVCAFLLMYGTLIVGLCVLVGLTVGGIVYVITLL